MKHMRTLDEVLADLRKAEKEYEKKLQEFEIKEKERETSKDRSS